MHTDKDLSALDQENEVEDLEDQPEEDLEWLLDMEDSDREETLFKVEGDEYKDVGLTDYEAQVASRPMTRGNAGGDDLANYVGEEIVISSETAANDIYGVNESAPEDEVEDAAAEQCMTVDFSREDEQVEQGLAAIDEGADVLGLASEDDIGETYLTIKRVRHEKPERTAETVARARPEESEAREQPMVAVTSSAHTLAEAVGGDTSSSRENPVEDTLSLDDLAEAPVTKQIADPEAQAGANEPLESPAAEELAQGERAPRELTLEEPALEEFATEETAPDESVPEELILEEFALEEFATEETAPDETVPEELILEEFALEEFATEESALDEPVPDELVLEEFDSEMSVLDEPPAEEFAAQELVLEEFDTQGFDTDDSAVAQGDQDVADTAPQSLDDEAFDEFLLNSDAFADSDIDFDELVIESSDDVLSLDTSDEDDIDFHEDFARIGASQGDLAERVTAKLPDLLREINRMAERRLQERGLDARGFDLDASLAMEDADVEARLAEGYAAMNAVLGELTPAVESLASVEERAVVYLRLRHDGESCNDLFDAESVPTEAVTATDNKEVEAVEASPFLGEPDAYFGADADALDAAYFTTESIADFTAGADADADDAEEVEAADGFAEDIFGDDFASELEEDLRADREGPDARDSLADIDDVFSMLAGNAADEAGELDIEAMTAEEDASAANADTAATPDVEPAVEGSAEAAPAAAKEAEKAGAGAEKVCVSAPADSADLSWCIPADIKFSYASQSGGEIFSEFLDAFIEEGSAEVEKLEDQVSEWEKDVGNEALFAAVTRTLHTVKGIAKGVGLQRLGTLVHNYETLLESLAKPSAHPEDVNQHAYFRIVNVWLDAVVRGIEFVTDERRDIAAVLPQVGQPAAAEEVAEARSVRKDEPVASTEEDRKVEQRLADEGAKVLASQQSVRITSEKLDHLLNLASQSQQLCVRASQTSIRSKRSTTELQGRLSSVRTHIGKIADRALLSVNARGSSSSQLDALEMDQYSELQEAASILREGVEDLSDLIEVLSRQNTQTEALLKQQSSVISSLATSIRGARVVPVSRLMPGLRRIVRTVSTDLGKLVNFRVLNEMGALDRDHYARLQVILEHMVRNALDHGIERPDVRLAAGKPEAGRIAIDVRKSGGDYLIRLSDDGKGIDPQALRESAYQKGLDVDVDALTDEEALRLVLHKGFSTATEVSEISGRGVGMDIVLSELQEIGGDIRIQSIVGEGTTFEVKIPSYVTVNGALMVTAADSSYAIPLNGLIAVEQVPAAQYFAAVQGNETLRLFDMDCEPAYLATLCQAVPLPERSFWESFVPVIIAGSEGRYMAIAIDSVEEALELVVRSLGSQFSAVPGLAGAATTADGEAIVALDLNLLVESVNRTGSASVAVNEDENGTLLALVVDDSRTQRMVATSQLDTVGVETVTAENGEVAIDLLNATHRLPDVVLLDVEMPVKDGIATLREIRKSQRYGHIPVIMVTSRTGAKHRALAKEAGCNAYMGKPFNFPALVEQINVLTGHNLHFS